MEDERLSSRIEIMVYINFSGRILKRRTRTNRRQTINSNTNIIMRNLMTMDFEFYEFVKQRFYNTYSKYHVSIIPMRKLPWVSWPLILTPMSVYGLPRDIKSSSNTHTHTHMYHSGKQWNVYVYIYTCLYLYQSILTYKTQVVGAW